MPPINLYLALLTAHLLYDWHWQGEFVGVGKASSDFILFIHSLTYACVMCAVLNFYYPFSIMWFIYILVTHYLVDYLKCRECPSQIRLTGWVLGADQALHVLFFIPVLIWP